MADTLDFATAEAAVSFARETVEEAIEEHSPIAKVVMYSGGGDSSVLLDICQEYLTGPRDGVLHINTGIGVEATREFVRARLHDLGLRLYEYMPPPMPEPWNHQLAAKLDPALLDRLRALPWADMTTYEHFVATFGFPGPAGHRLVYTRLKERALESFLRDVKDKRGQRVLLLTGVRTKESQRRMVTSGERVQRRGGQVWVAPINHFSNEQMHDYRERRHLPRNEVSDHLHMSGECICGAFATPGEKELLRFFYPEVAEYLDGLEKMAEAMGHRACKWGAGKLPKALEEWKKGLPATGPMCSSCDDAMQMRLELEGQG